MLTSEELIDQLQALGEYLERKRIIKSANPIVQACSRLQRNNKRCFIDGIELEAVKGDYIRGKEWDSDLDVKLTIDVQIKEKFCYEDGSFIAVNMEYSTLHLADARECKGCWHFDYHVDMEGSGEAEEYRYMHPHHHVHHGGREVKDLGSYGNMIILKSPRLIHHPMDALLAIDLALSNFLPSKTWQKIRSDSSYNRMMTDSQLAWWKPYYERLGNYWRCKGSKASNDKLIIEQSKELNPHLL